MNDKEIILTRDGLKKLAPNVDWPVVGGTQANTRYSPLTQVNTSNVNRLGIAWDLPQGNNLSSWKDYPVVVGRTTEVSQRGHPTHRVAAQGQRPSDIEGDQHLGEVAGELVDAVGAHRRPPRSTVAAVVIADDADAVALAIEALAG